MQMRLDLFIKIYKLKNCHFLTIISITLLFGDLVDTAHVEGTVPQNVDLSPSFHFMTKNG